MFGFAKRLVGSTAIAGAPLYATFNNVDMWTIMMSIMYAKLDGWSGWMDGAYWCPGSLRTGRCNDEMGSGG